MRTLGTLKTFALLTGLIVAGCREESAAPSNTSTASSSQAEWFIDVALEMGIDFTHDAYISGEFYMPEQAAGGCGWFDMDSDGDMDAYFLQGADFRGAAATKPNRVFRNDEDRFTDVTESSGLGDTGYGMGMCAADVDSDGDTDLYVTNVGPNRMYINLGNGRFEDRTESMGVGDEGWGTSCAFLDYNGDGRQDLFVTNYIRWAAEREKMCFNARGERDYCGPERYESPAPDVLYRNNGDGTFADVSKQAGFTKAFGNGLGVIVADFNDDMRTDIYVANDLTPNNLWINQGDGTFIDTALLAGADVNMDGKAQASMGVDAADIDDDGDLDLFMTHLENEYNTFYRNLGGGRFRDESVRIGFQQWSFPLTGFGTLFFDYDHDGDLDLFVANGRIQKHIEPLGPDVSPYAEANTLLRQEADHSFVDVSHEAGGAITRPLVSRGAAFADYDNDGDLDILISNTSGPAQLLRNDAPKLGHFAMVRAVSGDPPTDALGAAVYLICKGRTLRRDVRPAASYCSANDPRVHFGWTDSMQPSAMDIRWPDGLHERFDPPAANARVIVHRGAGRPIEDKRP